MRFPRHAVSNPPFFARGPHLPDDVFMDNGGLLIIKLTTTERERSRGVQTLFGKNRAAFMIFLCQLRRIMAFRSFQAMIRRLILHKTAMPESAEIKAIQIHHLSPGRHEIAAERRFRIILRVSLGKRTQLRVGAES